LESAPSRLSEHDIVVARGEVRAMPVALASA
jgi:hypothetical protein